MPGRPIVTIAAAAVILTATLAATLTACHAPAGSPAALRATVSDLEAFIAADRALQPTGPVRVALLSERSFLGRLRADSADDAADLTAARATLVALGLVPARLDIVRAARNLTDASVVGLYDPAAGTLFVRGTATTPFARGILVHELTHALQDQHFHLKRFDDLTGEAQAAVSALIEGDATRVEDHFEASLTPVEQQQLAAEQRDLPPPPSVPRVLLDLLVFPYVAGPAFVGALEQRDGAAAIDAAFRDPPTTTEQILHPSRYFDREAALAVRSPAPRGKVLDRGTLGEWGLRSLLRTRLRDADADDAAAGWGGDRYVTWRDGRRVRFAARIVMDDTREATELEGALRRWAGTRHVTVSRSRATITLTVVGPRPR